MQQIVQHLVLLCHVCSHVVALSQEGSEQVKDTIEYFILLVKAWTSLEDGSLLDHLAETCNEFFDRHNELHELG